MCERVFSQTQEKVCGDSRSLQNNVVGRTHYFECLSPFRRAVTLVEGNLPTRQKSKMRKIIKAEDHWQVRSLVRYMAVNMKGNLERAVDIRDVLCLGCSPTSSSSGVGSFVNSRTADET